MITHAAQSMSKGLRPGLQVECELWSCGRPKGDDLENGECPGGRACKHGASHLVKGAELIVDPSTDAGRIKVTCTACLALLAARAATIAASWERRLGKGAQG
jgi:hypothetical protein